MTALYQETCLRLKFVNLTWEKFQVLQIELFLTEQSLACSAIFWETWNRAVS